MLTPPLLGIRRHRHARHRHTMRNRIDAVERLTGRRMDSAQDRHELWLALRARDAARMASE
jgi:PucR family transcriptional regulator, purine catabolism regulatory protein